MRWIVLLALPWLSPCVNANAWDYDLSLRLRHQAVNDQWLPDAQATTLLGRGDLSWQPKDELHVFAQYDQVWALDQDSYNSITYWNAHSPIPDPPGGELNQLKLSWQFTANWQALIGRQHISFDNERHIGTAAYWQNDQTFDALSLRFNNGFDWNFNYSYVDKVHRIFGDDSSRLLPGSDPRFQYSPYRPPAEWGNHDHRSHLLNVNYHASPRLTLIGFAYLLDNRSLPAWSTDTLGFRMEGTEKPNSLKYSYNLEVARQQSGKHNPSKYQLWYLAAELGVQYRSHKWSLGYEYLGQDHGVGFNTSLATNHKFLGWADIFSRYESTDGIKDAYLSYEGRKGKVRWQLVGHSFDSINAHKNMGYELDLELAWRYSRKIEFKLLAASYRAQDGSFTAPATRYDLSTWIVSVAYNL